MATKTPGGRRTGHIALGFEAQEATNVGDPVHIVGDYEVELADGTRPVIGYVSVPNKKRTNAIDSTSVGDPNVPGDVTVEARCYSVQTTDKTGSAFDAGVLLGVGADNKLYPIGSNTSVVNEVQVATVTGTPTGGDFKLAFDGQVTGNIAFNATAAAVQSALEALSNVTPGDVSVSGSAGGPWTVTFKGQYAGENVAAMTLDTNGLTGGTDPSVTISTSTSGSGTVQAEYGIALTASAEAGDKVDVAVR